MISAAWAFVDALITFLIGYAAGYGHCSCRHWRKARQNRIHPSTTASKGSM